MRTPKLLLAVAALVAAACSRAGDPANPPAPTNASAPGPIATSPQTTAAPPAKPECAQDSDCDVLSIEVDGPHACCPSCRTTAGTRAWAAEIKARCAGASGANCYPLACPMGPTRPRCDAGRCTAVP